jgi:arylsulfatase A-like enzyme
VDSVVGEVLAALARTGLATNTLVVFTSDNGPECVEVHPGAYDRIRQFGHYSLDGLRGVKRDTWEGGHRVAFLARWPGHIPAGATSFVTICHVDLMATCAALIGARLPSGAGEDSYNILPALLGKKLKQQIREATVLHGCNGSFALRQGNWVLIDSPSGDNNGNKQHPGEPDWFKQARGYTTNSLPGELYNLRDDLPERRNLYAEMPDVAQRLKTLLEKYKAAGRSTRAPGTEGTVDSE